MTYMFRQCGRVLLVPRTPLFIEGASGRISETGSAKDMNMADQIKVSALQHAHNFEHIFEISQS